MLDSSGSEIFPELTIGNKNTASMYYDSYSLIINCTKNLPISNSSQITTIRIPIDDLPEDSEILLSYLPSITEKIHEAILKRKKVLVHCSMGISKSCTVVAAYLIRYYNVTSVDEVISFIKEKRKEAFFGGVHFRQLLEYWLNIKNNQSESYP